jgi:hypothetical protein
LLAERKNIEFSFALHKHRETRKDVKHMTDKNYDIRLKRLETKVKRQDEYLTRVLQLLTKLLARLVVLKNTSV